LAGLSSYSRRRTLVPADTTYIILRRVSHPQDNPGAVEQWEATGTVEAGSTDSALRRAKPENGHYVAVPARSWKPVTVTTETKTILKLEQPAGQS
jgi:hypothetical protein